MRNSPSRVPDRAESLQVAELTVGSNSDPAVVSGALAARVRESQPVCLTAIGSEAVAKSIRSICHARLYLEVSTLAPGWPLAGAPGNTRKHQSYPDPNCSFPQFVHSILENGSVYRNLHDAVEEGSSYLIHYPDCMPSWDDRNSWKLDVWSVCLVIKRLITFLSLSLPRN